MLFFFVFLFYLTKLFSHTTILYRSIGTQSTQNGMKRLSVRGLRGLCTVHNNNNNNNNNCVCVCLSVCVCVCVCVCVNVCVCVCV